MDRRVPWVKISGLGLLGIVAVLYTIEAFKIQTPPNVPDIGPGFLPRGVGVILTILVLLALIQALRQGDTGERGDARTTALFFVLTAVGVVLFLTIPWPVALGLYLMGALTVLNRPQVLVNAAVAVGLPLVLYLVFAVALGANVPE